MNCPNCGKPAQQYVEASYHYKESGLRNVFLKNSVVVTHCSKCESKFVEIPAIERLHDAISYKLLMKRSLLAGDEFRFLRKWIGLTAEKLAPIMGYKTRVTISKLENKMTPMSPHTDHHMRMVVISIKEESMKQRMNIEISFEEWMNGIKPKPKKDRITIDHDTIKGLPFPATSQLCA